MNLIEFIGFLITMIAMTFLIIRRVWEERGKTAPHNQAKEYQKAHLKQFLNSKDDDSEEESEQENEIFLPPPTPFVRQKQMTKRLKEPSSTKYLAPKVQNMAEGYHAIVKVKPSKASRMINTLPSRKEMIIYQEIMNPPVSMR